MGALTLTASGSHIDFGTGTVGVLSFASFTPGTNTLVIGQLDRQTLLTVLRPIDLVVDSDQALNLASFSFLQTTRRAR